MLEIKHFFKNPTIFGENILSGEFCFSLGGLRLFRSHRREQGGESGFASRLRNRRFFVKENFRKPALSITMFFWYNMTLREAV